MCRGQVIVAPMGGIIGLNAMAVDTVMNRMKVPEDQRDKVFFQVMALGSHFTAKMNKEKEE